MPNSILNRIRRNHGLEHATIHMLSEQHKGFSAQGNSDHRGFHLNIYGNVTEAEVVAAVEEAHRRLVGGEHQLAVHPNCGTVLVTTAALATLAAQSVFAFDQWRYPREKGLRTFDFLNSLPGAVVAVVVALIVGRPLGVQLQGRFTVDGNLGDMQVQSVRPVSPSLVTRIFHLLLTGGSRNLPPRAYFVRTTGGEN
ncbi:MAG: DUF6391 domain-containing protein [Chloroflexota bacterium]|jgi:ethanolamine utilization microcompartment shell protein EutL